MSETIQSTIEATTEKENKMTEATQTTTPTATSKTVIENGREVERKYELVEKVGNLWRIRACREFSTSDGLTVRNGEEGGLVQGEKNLSHDGNCWVGDNAKVYGEARVEGDALVLDTAVVCGRAKVYGNARVVNKALVFQRARVYGDAIVSGCDQWLTEDRLNYGKNGCWVYGNADVCDSAQVAHNARVYGNASVSGTAFVRDRAKVYGDAIVIDNAEVRGDAKVYGNSVIGAHTCVRGNAEVFGRARVYKRTITPEECVALLKSTDIRCLFEVQGHKVNVKGEEKLCENRMW